jgi:hypothetical protein
MASTISRLSEKVVDDLFTEYPTMFIAVSKAAYVNALQQGLLDVVNTDVQLSRVQPDYESVMLRLVQSLSNIPEWYDLITASTGHAIIRSIASGIAYSQFSLERAYQEAFLHSASSKSAIFSGVRQLGIRPQRRQPARVIAQISRGEAIDILTIPAYSVFTIGDMKFFNREAIIFNVNVFTTTKQLFQGVLQYETITSDGEPFQKYTIGAGEYNASDIDVYLTVDDVLWIRSTDGMHLFGREEQVYHENTAQNGDIEISFGNGDYGAIPQLSSTIEVTWVKTLGKDADTPASGISVKMDNPPVGVTISGTTITNIENGAEIITHDVYKKIAPSMYAAQGRAVRRSDFKAQAIKFPGVYDALFQGQAELAPGRRSMMNVVGYTLLTDENWNYANYQNFEDRFIQDLAIYRIEMLHIPSAPVIHDITATVYCRSEADLQDVYDTLVENMNKLYAPKLNFLGRSIFLSDISDVLNGRNDSSPNEKLEQLISYVVIDPSVADLIITNKRYYAKLGTLNLTMRHTTRDGYSGRLDIAPNQADTTIIT